jgi:hypothetical protein
MPRDGTQGSGLAHEGMETLCARLYRTSSTLGGWVEGCGPLCSSTDERENGLQGRMGPPAIRGAGLLRGARKRRLACISQMLRKNRDS